MASIGTVHEHRRPVRAGEPVPIPHTDRLGGFRGGTAPDPAARRTRRLARGGPRAEPAALSRRRPRRRCRDRPADLHHAGLRRRLLGAFRLPRREPGDAGVRPRQCRDVRLQGFLRAPLAERRGPVARPVRAAPDRREPRRAAGAVQRHFPRLGPEPEVAARRELSHSTSCRSWPARCSSARCS